ncbi:hypothetical protein [Candidatus Infernicultor aquiphilus]|uniref:hypothetical protein n=1 Tax=Candidatus Infernicultor aquiphilus TaxID=1805029 RepID=UPI003872EA93
MRFSRKSGGYKEGKKMNKKENSIKITHLMRREIIELIRTKTIMEGYECCDFRYVQKQRYN